VKWTDEMVEIAISNWKTGQMSGAEIALILERESGQPCTKNTVICKMARVGLSFLGGTRTRSQGAPKHPFAKRAGTRLSDMPADLASRIRQRKNEAARAKRAGARVPMEGLGTAPVAAPPAVLRPRPAQARSASGVPESLRIPLIEARDGMCRFIADDPQDRRGLTTVCGHPTALGSWCEGHALLVYEKPRLRNPAQFLVNLRRRKSA
jgi:hypothetical protein